MKPLRRTIRFEAVTPAPNESFLFRETFTPRIEVHWHHHPELELVLIRKGRGIRVNGDAVEPFHEGELFFFGANTPHAWHADPRKAKPVEAVLIQFPPDFLGPGLYERPEFRKLPAFFEYGRRGLLIAGRTRVRIVELLSKMCKMPTGSLERLSALFSIFALLNKGKDFVPLAPAPVETALNVHVNRKINTVFRFIDENLREMPPQTEAARLLKLSPQAFSRFFKRSVGKTYIEYVNELKIGLACRELIETEQSVTEIAYGAGFQTLSNFNRLFFAQKKLTPREYRKKNQV